MFKKNSIFSKILSSYILLTLSLITLIIIFSFNIVKDSYIKRLKKNLSTQCEHSFRLIEKEVNLSQFDELNHKVKKISDTIQARITVIDINGKVIVESDKDPLVMDNHSNRLEIKTALSGETGSSIRYSATLHKNMLYVAIPIIKEGKIQFVSRLSVPIDEVHILLNDFKKGIVNSALVVILIALFVTFFLAKQLSRPIKELKGAFEDISQGNLSQNVEIKSSNEINELANSFNLMANKLSQSMVELEDKRHELDTIINSINEALWVQNYDGLLFSCNNSFKKLFPSKRYENKHIWELIYDPDAKSVIENITSQKSDSIKEIKIDNSWFIMSSSKIDEEKVIFVMHNINELKAIEKFKKDFVLNASHELRTPLTAIKGFTQHLEEEANDSDRHYLKIILRNTERLINLVNDIQALAKLEQKPELRTSSIKLNDFLLKTKQIFESKLKESNLTLNISIPSDFPLIEVDCFKFEQIFVNLIDNAIRYTNSGG
ncbi:MAG: hypothetical protein B6226_05850, partial [Candidatus Cloacimonetes bacterium 4572_65]